MFGPAAGRKGDLCLMHDHYSVAEDWRVWCLPSARCGFHCGVGAQTLLYAMHIPAHRPLASKSCCGCSCRGAHAASCWGAVHATMFLSSFTLHSVVQVDALKTKLGAAEQQLADATRREAELRAEINMLSTTVTSTRQQHAKVGRFV